VITPIKGVLIPAFDLIAIREKELVTRYAPKNGLRRLETPIVTSSYEGSIV
jgi:hypothetical protein